MKYIAGYTDRWSVKPGETIPFMVSCSGMSSYSAELFRLKQPDAGPMSSPFAPEYITSVCNGTYSAQHQEIPVGSLALVRHPALSMSGSFTLTAYIKPTTPLKGRQALMGTWCDQSGDGYGLEISAEGELQLRIGQISQTPFIFSSGVPLTSRWYFVAAAYDATSNQVTLWQEPIDACDFHMERPIHVSSSAPEALVMRRDVLTMGAWRSGSTNEPAVKGQDRFSHHFNGCIDRPRVSRGALSRSEISFLDKTPLCIELVDRIVAAWDFSQAISTDKIVDIGPSQAHGMLHNQPSRAVPGHNWSERGTDWTKTPELYGAIHFHDDDLSDACWSPDFKFEVPMDMRSGIYAFRLTAESQVFWIPFTVRPQQGATNAKVAFLLPTATYTAYQNHRGRFKSLANERLHGRLNVIDHTDMMFLDHAEMGLSTYDCHSDGSGVAYASRHRPAQNIRPTGRLWNFSVDLMIIDWLEHLGEGYDVITDDDLHSEGLALLKSYSVVITGSHPEYTSLQMLDALHDYLRGGGRLMYMGGNGFYWRIAYHPTRKGIIEVRRPEGVRAWDAIPGSNHMSFTGERGGLWRNNGRAPQRLVGVGFVGQGFDRSSYYRRTAASYDSQFDWAFKGISDEVLGNFGHLQGGAAGIEVDACNFGIGTPSHTVVFARSENHSNTYELAGEEVLVPHGATDAAINPAVKAEMIFFETAHGGAVFGTGSIAYAGAIGWNGFDNNIFRLTTNVLRRFLDPAPFSN